MNDSGSSGVDVDDDVEDDGSDDENVDDDEKVPKLSARTAQKKHHLLYRKQLCCMTTHALK